MTYKQRVLDTGNQEFKLDEEEVQAYRAGRVDFEDWSDFVVKLPPILEPTNEPISLLIFFATSGIMPWLTGFLAYIAATLADSDELTETEIYDRLEILSDWGIVLADSRTSDQILPESEESIIRRTDYHRHMTRQEIPRKFVLDQGIDELMEQVTLEQKQLLAILFSVLRSKDTWTLHYQGIQLGLDTYFAQFLVPS